MGPQTNDVAQAIQLALAPVFLLAGVGALLNVMTGRLARIIDRGRAFVEGRVPSSVANPALLALERRSLEQRRRLTSVAITASTVAALLVCTVIAALFLEVMLQAPLKWLISALFTGAMLAQVVGLTYFLREVHLATHNVRFE